jgi:hypothetical protein
VHIRLSESQGSDVSFAKIKQEDDGRQAPSEMKQQSQNEEELRRYLLGELPPEDHLSVEERLFLDGEYLLRLQAVEDELVDDYVYDELAESERERFEAHFLSKPERHDDLRFARALRKYTSSEEEIEATPLASATRDARPPTVTKNSYLPLLFKRYPVASFSLAVVALLIVSVVVWLTAVSLIRRNQSFPMRAQAPGPQQAGPGDLRRPETEGNTQDNRSAGNEEGQGIKQQGHTDNAFEVNSAEQSERRAARSRGTSSAKQGPSTRALAFLLLPGGAVRGEGETKRISFPSRIHYVILNLPLDDANNYRGYQAELQSAGNTIHTWTGLKSTVAESGKIRVVALKVPTNLLGQQSYQIKLAGLTASGQPQDIATYSFQVNQNQ